MCLVSEAVIIIVKQQIILNVKCVTLLCFLLSHCRLYCKELYIHLQEHTCSITYDISIMFVHANTVILFLACQLLWSNVCKVSLQIMYV